MAQARRNYLSPDQFVPLKAEYLRNYIVGFREFWPLIQDKIVERDNYYVPTQKAYGYRLCEPYRSQRHRLVQVKDNAIVKKVRIERQRSLKLPVHRAIRDNLDRVTIDAEGFHRRFKTFENYPHYARIVQTIQDGDFHLKPDDFAGRCHTIITRLFKPLRSLLRADGERLVEVDIRNSQPLFLGLHLRQRGIPASRYVELVQSGELYDHLAAQLDVSRDDAKEELLKTFYSKNGYSSPLKRLFATEFPEVADFIHKAKIKDHTRLARTMQKAEARFIIHTVCERLRQDHEEVWFTTIHDSIMCKPNDLELVTDIINEEFRDFDIRPRLKTTLFDQQYETDYDDRRERLLKILHHGGYHE